MKKVYKNYNKEGKQVKAALIFLFDLTSLYNIISCFAQYNEDSKIYNRFDTSLSLFKVWMF